jgi:hypothetical protein
MAQRTLIRGQQVRLPTPLCRLRTVLHQTVHPPRAQCPQHQGALLEARPTRALPQALPPVRLRHPWQS